ncbi:aldehyde dehydrogenase family protein [Actinomadura craniellae]|nr:aldehyde dehydrogenase family protein [Actinomadura craniellae]
MKQNRSWVEQVSAGLADKLERNSSAILECLTRYETWGTAHDEIFRSIRTLNGIAREWQYIRDVDQRLTVASFLPVNQPLYGLTLFGIMPALMVRRVEVRPSWVTADVVSDIWKRISVPELESRLSIRNTERRHFTRECASESDAVILTGTYATALSVARAGLKSGSLLIFNGSGVNPVVVMPDADLGRAADGIIRSVTYNSGQDCAAPKCVLIHSIIADEIIGILASGLRKMNIGSCGDPAVDIGPVARPSSVTNVVDFLTDHRGEVVVGGCIDVPRRLIHPTLVVSRLDDQFRFPELYAPVLNIGVFDDPDTVMAFIHSDRYQRHAMYASVYGSLKGDLLKTTVLRDETVLDHEDGNLPFGGWGTEASFVKRSGEPPIRGPVLVSAALSTVGQGGGR